MEQYYVLKKKSDEYFYGFEENSKTPKFGEFNLSLIHIFDNSDYINFSILIIKFPLLLISFSFLNLNCIINFSN